MSRLAGLRLPARILAVILVILLAGGLRWRAVNLLPPDYDEDDYLRAAQEYAALFRAGDWSGFLETNYQPAHPPLAKLAYGLAILSLPAAPLIPDRPTTAAPDSTLPQPHLNHARSQAAAFGTLEVALLALVNPLGGFWLAIHTFTIKYTSQVMLESLPAVTSLLCALAYLQWKKRRETQRVSAYGWLVISAFCLGLTAAAKYLYAVIGFAVILDWFIIGSHAKRTKQIAGILLWGLLSIAVFFAANPYLWPDPVGRLGDSLFFHASYSTSAAEVQSAAFPDWQPLVWLSMSVPWHPGVFIFSLDALITLLAVFGLKRLWHKERLYVYWLLITLGFLFIWQTKWPQYILVLTAPLSLAAAEGAQEIYGTARRWVTNQIKKHKEKKAVTALNRQEICFAMPWLLPGIIALSLLALFPLLFQLAMALTDFNGAAIRDGISGGVWRAVWLGLTGQTAPVDFDPFGIVSYVSNTVNYAGPQVILRLMSGIGASILVFDILWTVLSVALQASLGIAVALMLNRRGVYLTGFWQTIFILPWAIPEFIGALTWLRVFEPQIGWLDILLPAGIPLPQTFDDTRYALLVLLIAGVWYGFPFIMLAASASLKLIPKDVYDAAALDGAHGLTLFQHVTWPLLQPLVVPAIIIRSIFAFNQFYLFYVMQTDIPLLTFANASYLVFTYGNQYAVSAAINIFTVIVLVFLLIWFNRWSKAAQGVTYV